MRRRPGYARASVWTMLDLAAPRRHLMQSLMDRLSAFVRARRKLVIGAWVLLLLVSVPFASRQTENLTAGGFEVPGSGSAAVDAKIKRFQGASSEQLGVV